MTDASTTDAVEKALTYLDFQNPEDRYVIATLRSLAIERDEVTNQLDSARHSISVLERNLRLKHDMLVDCDMKRDIAQKQADELLAILERRQLEDSKDNG